MQQPPSGGQDPGSQGTVTCQICGAVSPIGLSACPRCHARLAVPVASSSAGGAEAPADSVRCQMCAALNLAGAETCRRCGASLVERGGLATDASGAAAGLADEGTDEEARRCSCGATNPLTAPACMVCGNRLIGPLTHQVIGSIMPAVEISLQPGQRVYAQTHCLGWMSEHIEMRTLPRGSAWRLLGRVASGMTLLVSQFQAPTKPGVVAFTPQLPGRILSLDLSPGHTYILQPGAFLAAQDSVSLHAFFTRNIGAGLFGGEGFILQRLSGHGLAFLQIGGEMVEYDLPAGEVLLVDPGTVAAFEDTVRFSVRMMKGISNIMFSQGMFLAELRGPGRVWVETMPMSRLIAALSARMPLGGSPALNGAIAGLHGVLGSG